MLAYDHLQETKRVWIDEVIPKQEMTLSELAELHNTDKLWHGYTQHYEHHFWPLINKPIALLEIGVASGASMRMWNDYFRHPDAFFLGIDIVEDTPKDFDNRTAIAIADGTTYRHYNSQGFDIIIDDGSHTSEDIVAGIGNWWHLLNHGGWYVVEDLAVQWRNDYGGGGTGSTATMMLHEFVDQLWQKDQSQVTEFHAYDEIVFLRKA